MTSDNLCDVVFAIPRRNAVLWFRPKWFWVRFLGQAKCYWVFPLWIKLLSNSHGVSIYDRLISIGLPFMDLKHNCWIMNKHNWKALCIIETSLLLSTFITLPLTPVHLSLWESKVLAFSSRFYRLYYNLFKRLIFLQIPTYLKPSPPFY